MDTLLEFKKVLEIETQALSDCLSRLTQKEFQKQIEGAVECMLKSLSKGGKIVVTGVGKSGKVGQKISATLSSTGSLSVFLHPTEGLHGDLGLVTSGDVVLALSYSGNTEELLRLLPSLKNRKVPIIAIAGHKESRLQNFSDFWIDASVSQEACPHNLAPTSSTTLTLAIGDALAITLMKKRGFMPENFAENHPGGAIGNRLTLKVSELMLGKADVSIASPETSVDEVLVLIAAKTRGSVLVVDQNKLLGLITDGDIRRSLKHKEKFFNLKAKDLMTVKPLTITPDALAYDALKLMEKRPGGQIKELPVVDANQNWLGLIRLHDIVQFF